MSIIIRTIALLSLLSVLVVPTLSIAPKVDAAHLRNLLRPLDRAFPLARAGKSNDVHDRVLPQPTLKCALCAIAVNEIEGMLAENATVSAIEQRLEALCDALPTVLKFGCIALAEQLPNLIAEGEKRWTVSFVCIKLGLCLEPFPVEKEVVPAPIYTIHLDEPAEQRFTEVCSQPHNKAMLGAFFTLIRSVLPGNGEEVERIGEYINSVLPSEYAAEIRGCAKAANVSMGWLSLLNLGYELSDACTSIVAQAPDGRMLHARNLDFFAGMALTDYLRDGVLQLNFVDKNSVTQYRTTGFAGYVGALSGIRPSVFSVTINTRFYPGGLGELFYEVIEALKHPDASMVAFLTRDQLATAASFDEAVRGLSTTRLIADVYYTVAGVSAGEGVVISRNRTGARDVRRVDASQGRWYVLQTNYDWWKAAPWFDDRRGPAVAAMNAMGAADVTLDGLFNVLSTKPVLNIQTTYSILSVPANDTWKSFGRYCNFPCVE